LTSTYHASGRPAARLGRRGERGHLALRQGIPLHPFPHFSGRLAARLGRREVSEDTSRSGRDLPCTLFLINSGLNDRKLCIGIEDISRNDDV